MKKTTTHLIVLAMSAVFTLSACERRQRPQKPKTAEKTEQGETNSDGTPITPPTEIDTTNVKNDGQKQDGGSTQNDSTKDETTKTGNESAEAGLTQEDFEKRADALNLQIAALNELNLGIRIATNPETKKFEVSMDKDTVIKAIQVQAETNAIEAGDDRISENQNIVAGQLHKVLLAAHAAAQDLIQTYAKSETEVNPVKGMESPEGIAKIQTWIDASRALDAAIDDIDAALHADAFVTEEHEFHSN